jgi:hypothetical protein
MALDIEIINYLKAHRFMAAFMEEHGYFPPLSETAMHFNLTYEEAERAYDWLFLNDYVNAVFDDTGNSEVILCR